MLLLGTSKLGTAARGTRSFDSRSGGLWVETDVFGDEHDARIEPFAEIALHVASWWT